MLEQNLILVYEGEFTQEITKSVLAMAERNMDSMGEESSIKRKVFNVMVECLQNVVKHAESQEVRSAEGRYNAIFMIGKKGNDYIITSGNPLLNKDIDKLKGRLDEINSLDKEGLKNLYKEIIKTTSISEIGGAGLGFVDMDRKSGRKLEYGFEPMSGDHSFFSLRTIIEGN
jgi:hypothetical protein